MGSTANVRILSKGEADTLVLMRQLPRPDLSAKQTPAPVDREAATVFIAYGRHHTMVPLVTVHCGFCGDLVDVVHGNATAETFGVCRVNGDSEYGYEPYHINCLT